MIQVKKHQNGNIEFLDSNSVEFIPRHKWSVGDIARELGEKESCIRYWESRLPFLSPKERTNNNDRRYTREQRDRRYTREERDRVHQVHSLVRGQGVSIDEVGLFVSGHNSTSRDTKNIIHNEFDMC